MLDDEHEISAERIFANDFIEISRTFSPGEKERGTAFEAVPPGVHSIPGNLTWWPCEQWGRGPCL